MPLSDLKVVRIVLEEVDTLDERCDGYREEIQLAIADIMRAEREHRTKGTNIQQRVSDKCNATGEWLAAERARKGNTA